MRLLRCVWMLLLLLVWVSDGWAQSEADTATARELAQEANSALEQKDYQRAADLFGRAEKLHHAPTLLVGLARAYTGLGKYVEAREAYNKALREELPSNANPALKKAVEDAKLEVVALEDKIGWVTIQVEGAQEPKVTIDDQNVAVASLGVKRAVNPGVHVVRAIADGYKSAEASVEIEAGASKDVELKLEIDPNAKVSEDPKPDGGGAATSSGSPSTLQIVGFVGIGVGAAGLIVGAVTGGLAMGKHNELEDNCPDGQCPGSQRDNLDAFRTLGTVSTVGFVVGGVLAAAGIVLVIVAPSNDAGGDAADAAVELEIAPAHVGARLRF